MMLKIVDEGEFRDIVIDEGDMFLVPRECFTTPYSIIDRFLNIHYCKSEHAPQPRQICRYGDFPLSVENGRSGNCQADWRTLGWDCH